MSSEVVVLGPFSGGLNSGSDASAIAPNELSECVNFNVDSDGSLVCRPPISQAYYTPTSGAQRLLMIGTCSIGGTNYVISSSNKGIQAHAVSSVTSDFVTHMSAIVISATLTSQCAIQLHNSLFILATPNSASNGGIWDGTTFTADVSAPRGSSAIFFKGRVWVTPGAEAAHPASSQLKFSDPVPIADPVVIPWDAVNLIPVGQGDGEILLDLVVVADNLMLFKNNSTYAFMYDVSPNEGLLRVVNANIGTSAQFCVLTHGNEAYTYHEGKLYQIANYTFIDTSVRIPFRRDFVIEDSRTEKVCVSSVGDFILLRYFDSLYALNLVTKTWSKWESANGFLDKLGRVVKMESNTVVSTLESYYGGSVLSYDSHIYSIKEDATETDEEFYLNSAVKVPVAINLRMTTKIFDFETPHLFKRLKWWGIDVISDQEVQAIVRPISQTGPMSWDDLSSYTWESLGAWDSLTYDVSFVSSTVDDVYDLRRKFVKLLKSVRFRRVSFTVKLTSDGKIAAGQSLGPARLFTISAIVGAKQTVPKQVS